MLTSSATMFRLGYAYLICHNVLVRQCYFLVLFFLLSHIFWSCFFVLHIFYPPVFLSVTYFWNLCFFSSYTVYMPMVCRTCCTSVATGGPTGRRRSLPREKPSPWISLKMITEKNKKFSFSVSFHVSKNSFQDQYAPGTVFLTVLICQPISLIF